MTANLNPHRFVSSRWPHRVAVLLVCATFPLIWVGGLVTTYDAGMAVPDWPSTYGYNLFLYPVATWLSGPWDLFIEHGHRLLASGVGMITLVLVVAVWLSDKRLWVKWYVVGCLGLVVGQGVLGGMRVLLDQTFLARVHGCVGPLFFVASVVAAAITSRWWLDATPVSASAATVRYVRLAWVTAFLAYLQLVLGAHLRHVPVTWTPTLFRGVVIAHLVGALVLTAYAVVLICRAYVNRQLRERPLVFGPALAVVGMIAFQVVLGAGVWRLKYHWPVWVPQPAWFRGYAVTAESMLQTLTVTAHVAIGSLIVAASVLLAVRVSRLFTASTASPVPPTVALPLELLV